MASWLSGEAFGLSVPGRTVPAVDSLPRPATASESITLVSLFPELLPDPPLRRYQVTVTAPRRPGGPPAILPAGIDGVWLAEKTEYTALVDAVDQASAARCALSVIGDEASWDAEVQVRPLTA